MSIENIEEEVMDMQEDHVKGIEMNGLVEDTLVFNI